MKKTYKFIMLGLATFAVLNGYIFSASCDLTSYMTTYWNDTKMEQTIAEKGAITWNDVNSVANTGEDYQVLSGVDPKELKKYFTAADVLEGFALGKVSQDYLTYIYCSDPTYWAAMKAQAEMGGEYERYYKYYQGKAPSTTSSVPSQADTSSKDEPSSKNETTTKDENGTSITKEKQEGSVEVTESITGVFVVIVDTVVLDTPNGNKIGTIEKGNEITVSGSGNGYYQLKYNSKAGYILINNETIIPKEEYDKAWTETDKVEPTCTEDGYVTLTNSYSQIEKTTPIVATGHEYEWVTTKEASFFITGEEQHVCKNCGDVSETRKISPTFPLPVVGIISIALLGIIGIIIKVKMR